MLMKFDLADGLGSVVIIAASFFSAPSFAADGGDLEARFRSEAPKAWAVLDAAEDSFEVAGSMTSFTIPNTERSFHYLRSGKNLLYEFEQPQVTPGEVRCSTPDQAFVLVRKESGSPWAIKSFGRLDAKSTKNIEDNIHRQFIPQELVATHGINGVRLSELVKDPTFTLKSVEPLRRDGVELVLVRFENLSPAVGSYSRESLQTEAILRPDKHWSVQEVVVKSPDGATSTTRCEYVPDNASLPTLTRFMFTLKMPDGKGNWNTSERVDRFSKYSNQPAPDEAFTLGAFGLPDPDRKVGPSTGWRAEWIFLSLAVAFGVLAIALRVRWSRSRRVQAPADR